MRTSSSHIIKKSLKTNITDYQGNIRQVVNPDGEVLQDNHYYPFGMLMGESSDIVAANLPQGHFTDGGGNRFRYGAKELITTGGVNLSDYTARILDHATLRFLTPDPLREKYTSMSSYLYCGANPVMFIDPTGCAEFWCDGEIIGNDGVDDGKVYVMKTTEESYGSGENTVSGANLSEDDKSSAIEFVKANSGNLDAFSKNSNIYNNFTEIEGDEVTRLEMYNIIKDDSSGGTEDWNNREYGGYITEDGTVIASPPGEVSTPKKGASMTIEGKANNSTFHSHPSGSLTEDIYFYTYAQIPSVADVKAANYRNRACYVFAMRERKVYIYNGQCVLAEIPMSQFIQAMEK